MITQQNQSIEVKRAKQRIDVSKINPVKELTRYAIKNEDDCLIVSRKGVTVAVVALPFDKTSAGSMVHGFENLRSFVDEIVGRAVKSIKSLYVAEQTNSGDWLVTFGGQEIALYRLDGQKMKMKKQFGGNRTTLVFADQVVREAVKPLVKERALAKWQADQLGTTGAVA